MYVLALPQFLNLVFWFEKHLKFSTFLEKNTPYSHLC